MLRKVIVYLPVLIGEVVQFSDVLKVNPLKIGRFALELVGEYSELLKNPKAFNFN
jgi:hypothetical protein